MNERTNRRPRATGYALCILLPTFLCSCSKAREHGTALATASPVQIAAILKASPTNLPSPVYVFDGSLVSKILNEMDTSGPNSPRWYKRKEMIGMTTRYVNRMLHARDLQHMPGVNPGADGIIDPKSEYMFVYLDGGIVRALLDTIARPKTSGLLAVFAVQKGDTEPNPKHNTFFLVPYSQKDDAVTVLDDPTGVERWPTTATAVTLEDVSADASASVEQKVDKLFTRWKMPVSGKN